MPWKTGTKTKKPAVYARARALRGIPPQTDEFYQASLRVYACMHGHARG